MGINYPFRRTVRQLADGSYAHSGNGRYVTPPAYAKDADKYIRAYLLIQAYMVRLFDYVSGSDINLNTYSFRIHEVIIRTCIEVEANFKAILRDNDYRSKSTYNILDFIKVDPTHRLSSYRVKLPYWDGKKSVRRPFLSFKSKDRAKQSPHWYKAYNATKHDRHLNFHRANLEAMIDAVCGLAVLLAAQYRDEDFAPIDPHLTFTVGPGDGYGSAIGQYFRISYPEWPVSERYDFNWQTLKDNADPFLSHHYT